MFDRHRPNRDSAKSGEPTYQPRPEKEQLPVGAQWGSRTLFALENSWKGFLAKRALENLNTQIKAAHK